MFSSYAVILLSAIIWLSHCQEADNDNGSSSMANFFDILIPVEQLPSRGNSRAVEWYKYFKVCIIPIQSVQCTNYQCSSLIVSSRNMTSFKSDGVAIVAAH